MYKKVKFYTHETLGFGEINLPSEEMQTTAYWIALNSEVVESLKI